MWVVWSPSWTDEVLPQGFGVMADIVVFEQKKSSNPEFVKKVPVFCEFVEWCICCILFQMVQSWWWLNIVSFSGTREMVQCSTSCGNIHCLVVKRRHMCIFFCKPGWAKWTSLGVWIKRKWKFYRSHYLRQFSQIIHSNYISNNTI